MRERGTCGTVTYHPVRCATRPKKQKPSSPCICHICLPDTRALRNFQISTRLRFAKYDPLSPLDRSGPEEPRSLHRPVSPIPNPVTTSRYARHDPIRIHLDRRFTCTSGRGSPFLTDLSERSRAIRVFEKTGNTEVALTDGACLAYGEMARTWSHGQCLGLDYIYAVSALEWRAEVLVTFSQGSHASTMFFGDPCANVGEVTVALSDSGVY
jgi:hypothetical protein